jgi:hypothetical protein
MGAARVTFSEAADLGKVARASGHSDLIPLGTLCSFYLFSAR